MECGVRGVYRMEKSEVGGSESLPLTQRLDAGDAPILLWGYGGIVLGEVRHFLLGQVLLLVLEREGVPRCVLA